MVRVQTTLDSSKRIRADTAQAVEDMPPDAVDFRPAEGLMTFREIARHILNASHALTGLLLDGAANLAIPEFRDMLKKHSAALRQALDRRISELSGRDAEFFAEEITRFDGLRATRLEMLQTIEEHELTHRSQLFVYLRLKGVVPPTTRRRELAGKRVAGQAQPRP